MRTLITGALRALAAMAALATTLALHAQPLSPPEFQAVLGEIRAMIRTDENDVPRFVVHEATPERIERFYASPELATLPGNVRENGLVFGGLGGHLLAFDRPSDVLAKMERWFPAEFAVARKDPRISGTIRIRVWGPYENWQPEPTAFAALWKCFPQTAWLRPGQQPFARVRGDWHPMMPWAARQTWGYLNIHFPSVDFGRCVRELSGHRAPKNEQELPRQRAIAAGIGERAIPPLLEHFARVQPRDGCRRTGPDDCVLLLNAWASLRAADPALARALQSLEAQVAPDARLPAPHVHVATPSFQYVDESAPETIAAFNAGLRIGGFLQAKLRSVLAAPQAWPAGALARTFAQMSRLGQQMLPAYANDHGDWRLAENPAANPWLALPRANRAAAVDEALLHELARMEPDPDCVVHGIWFDYGGAALETRFVQQQQAAHVPVRCGHAGQTPR